METVNELIEAKANGESITDEQVEEWASTLEYFSTRALSGDNRDQLLDAYRELKARAKELTQEEGSSEPTYRPGFQGASLGCPECGGPSAIKGEPCDSCRDSKPTTTDTEPAEAETAEEAEEASDEDQEPEEVIGEVVESEIVNEGSKYMPERRATIKTADGRTYELADRFSMMAEHAIEEKIEDPQPQDWNEVT